MTFTYANIRALESVRMFKPHRAPVGDAEEYAILSEAGLIRRIDHRWRITPAGVMALKESNEGVPV